MDWQILLQAILPPSISVVFFFFAMGRGLGGLVK